MAFISLLVYAVAMLIRPHEWGVLVNEESTIVRDSLLVCLMFFMFHQHKNFQVPQFGLMVGFVGAIFMSILATGWLGGAFERSETFIRIAFVPFILISALVDSLNRHQILSILIIIAALLMVYNGYIQASDPEGIGLVGNPILREGPNNRITYLGFLADPNDLGMYFIMTLPLIFYFKQLSPVIFRFLHWGAITALLFGIYLTNSRGALLATLSLMFLWFWRNYGTTKSIFIGLAGSPVVLVVMSSFREISADDESSQGRLDAWYAGYQMLVDSPVFGVGQGAFTEYNALTAHNSLVLAFAELGLLGSILWVTLLTVTALTLLKIADRKYLPPEFATDPKYTEVAMKESLVAISLLYSLAAYVVTGFFLSRTYIPILYLYLGLSAACLGRVQRAYPNIKADQFYNMNFTVKVSLGITLGAILAIFVLVRIFI